VRATTRLNEITGEITASIEEQATGTQAIVKAMDEMRCLVQESSSSSMGLAASAEQMSQMSIKLLGVMDGFKLQVADEKRKMISSSGTSALLVSQSRAHSMTATRRQ
jgi:hypothetical protein